MRILVIEDDDRIRSFTSNGLRQEGHVVDDTASAQDGLAFWSNGHYDAIILDLTLPHADGMDILKTMRQKATPPPSLLSAPEKP